MSAVERRASEVRLTMGELCHLAKIHPSSWSKAKARGRVRVSTIRKLEDQLSEHEAANG